MARAKVALASFWKLKRARQCQDMGCPCHPVKSVFVCAHTLVDEFLCALGPAMDGGEHLHLKWMNYRTVVVLKQ